MPAPAVSFPCSRKFFERVANLDAMLALFDHLPAVYFFVKDSEGRFMRMNRPLLDVLGIEDEQEVVGRTDDDYFSHELAHEYRAEDREVMSSSHSFAGRVALVPDRNGVLRWFVQSKVPLLDAEGHAIGIAGAMQDVQNSGAVLGPYREMSAVVAYISEHYAEKISIDELAQLACLSSSQFTRRFRKLFQMTPARYITRVRVNAACQQLTRTTSDLVCIAEQAGFHDASHLIKQFKLVMKVTPQTYRDKWMRGVDG